MTLKYGLKVTIKIIQTGTIQKLGCGSPVSYSPSVVNMAVSLTVYEIFGVRV